MEEKVALSVLQKKRAQCSSAYATNISENPINSVPFCEPPESQFCFCVSSENLCIPICLPLLPHVSFIILICFFSASINFFLLLFNLFQITTFLKHSLRCYTNLKIFSTTQMAETFLKTTPVFFQQLTCLFKFIST